VKDTVATGTRCGHYRAKGSIARQMPDEKMGLQELPETPKERSRNFRTRMRTGKQSPVLPVSGFSSCYLNETRGMRQGNRNMLILRRSEALEQTSAAVAIFIGCQRGEDCLVGAQNSKGCDIGYALAANSCEGANNMDACTVTALDATTAFAVPDPGLLLAELAGFFGSWHAPDRSAARDHPVYFGSATVYFD
jgi:hypothetical protein